MRRPLSRPSYPALRQTSGVRRSMATDNGVTQKIGQANTVFTGRAGNIREDRSGLRQDDPRDAVRDPPPNIWPETTAE